MKDPNKQPTFEGINTSDISRFLNYDLAEDVRPHNTMRFDIELAHIYVMIAHGEIDPSKLAGKIKAAIIAVVDQETQWSHACSHKKTSDFLHHEKIFYDFS